MYNHKSSIPIGAKVEITLGAPKLKLTQGIKAELEKKKKINLPPPPQSY
jgi:hypothetical protein